MQKRVLFVSHEASHTGAPIVLLHLITWIKKNTNLQFEILLLTGGSLTNSFESVSKVHQWQNKKLGSNLFVIRGFYLIYYKILDKIFACNFYQKKVTSKIKKLNFDLIYCNTIASSHIIPIFKNKEVKIISHIHELSWLIDTLYKNEVSNSRNSLVDLFIAVSNATQNNLMGYNIPLSKIKLVYEFVPVLEMSKPTITHNEIKDALQINKEAFVIGGSGKMQWRKGCDLFFQLSWLIQKKVPNANIQFLWVGATNYEEVQWYYYETKLQGLQINVHFTEQQNKPQNYFQVFDVFALTSREDPFPLVCLEAASLGKPILCFEGAGGMPEFVDKGGGFKVPYHNLDEMANKILELYNNRNLVFESGQNAKQLVNEYDINIAAPKIYFEIEKLLSV
jgi:glycosyltransferase involved in cell wall biosynthesis